MRSPPHGQTSDGKGHRFGASGACLLYSVAGDLAAERGRPDTRLWECRIGILGLGYWERRARGDGITPGIKIRVPYGVGCILEPSRYLFKSIELTEYSGEG